VTFLGLNDVAFFADEASGRVDEDGLVRWIRDNWPKGGKRCNPRAGRFVLTAERPNSDFGATYAESAGVLC
jgi:hypothetical protein